MARRFGLRACWSTPIFSPQRKVLGSFAMYYDEPRSPSRRGTAADRIGGRTSPASRSSSSARSRRCSHSEARNRAILRAIPDWMFLTTVDGVFLDYHAKDASQAVIVATGGIPGQKHQRGAAAAAWRDACRSASSVWERPTNPRSIEYTLGSDDSERFYEACIVRCDGDKILSIVRDITDRKRAELEADAQRRELAHLSRVAMLGELTGALAHELSQPLTAVLSNAQAARHLAGSRSAGRSRSCGPRSTTSSGTPSGPARSSIACAPCCGRRAPRSNRST